MNKKQVIYIILIIITFLTSIFSSKLYFDKIEQKKFNNNLSKTTQPTIKKKNKTKNTN